MGFPDQIERTVAIAHPPSEVWAALTTAVGLAAWFGNEAAIDLRPGGSARMSWTNGHTVDMRVPPDVFDVRIRGARGGLCRLSVTLSPGLGRSERV